MIQNSVKVPPDLLAEATRAAEEAGFDSADEFVCWAVQEKLRELRREFFYAVTDRIKAGLEERAVSPAEVLDDFRRSRRA